MRFTNITAFLIVALSVDEVSPFSFFGKSLGKRRRSSLKSSSDSPAFFASVVEVIEEAVDVSVPYDAAARLAYDASNKTMSFERFNSIYRDRAVELVKSKQPGYVPSKPYEPVDVSVPYDAAVELAYNIAYEKSETRLLFDAYRKIYIEDVVNMVTRKNNDRKRQAFAAKYPPKPPITPPPVPQVVDEKFARMIAKLEDSKDVAFEKIVEFAKTIEFADLVKNIEFKIPEIQEGVPEESIKGAALLTAGLAFLSTKGVVISSAAGLSAAFASMQRGQIGDIFRSFGSVTWDATEAATQLVRAATADERVTGLSKELAAKVTGAIDKYQSEQMAMKKSADSKTDDVEAEVAAEVLKNSPELVAQFLQEVEAVIDQADAAMALADETLGRADKKLDSKDSSDIPLEDDEEEFEEISSSVSDEEPEELDDEVEDETVDMQDSLEEDDKEETSELILDEVEEMEEEDEEYAADEDINVWAATLQLAQEGIGGKIIGMDEVINDAAAKANWEAAGKFAEELGKASERRNADDDEAFMLFDDKEEEESSDSDEDLENMMPEGDLEAIARAAREAVAKSGETIEDDDEDDDSDFEAVEDMLPEGNLEDIARAAREAVAMSGETLVDDEDEDDESFSDSDLEAAGDMIPEGDLEEIARAARKAVAMSTKSVMEDDDDEEDDEIFMSSESDLDAADGMMPEGDLEDIARAAREAVEKARQGSIIDEDDDFEDFEDFDDFDDFEDIRSIDKGPKPSSAPLPLRDWSTLTVSVLREECKVRGIKAHGLRKAALVAQLEEYELNLYNGDDSEADAAEGSGDDWEFELDDVDLAALGAQARAAVQAYEDLDDDDDDVADASKINWDRIGTPSAGVDQAIGDAEEDSDDDSDWELEFDELDMAKLGEQARAAVQASGDLFDDDGDDDDRDFVDTFDKELTVEQKSSAPSSGDYNKMTVIELKEELKKRGLKVSGKKADLIERLQSA